MGKDKNTGNGETTTSETNSPLDAHCQNTQHLSLDHEAQDATLAQTIAKAVAREMAKAHAHYQAILNERSATTLHTSLKISSGTKGFKVMDPFNWTKDKSIYQRWQLWSEKARLPLIPWREIQRKPRFLTSIIGSMEREWHTLSHGKTARPSSANQHMMN